MNGIHLNIIHQPYFGTEPNFTAMKLYITTRPSICMNYLETAKKVIFSPKKFFNDIPTSGGYGEPIKFAVINITIATLLLFVKDMLLGELHVSFISLIFAIIPGTLLIILGALIIIIGLFFAYCIMHIFLKLFGAKNTLEATFRVGASLTALLLLIWIPVPYFEQIMGVYTLYHLIRAFAKVHEISIFRSFVAVLFIPLSFMLVVLFAGFGYVLITPSENDNSSVNLTDLFDSMLTDYELSVDYIVGWDQYANLSSTTQTGKSRDYKSTIHSVNVSVKNIGKTMILGKDLNVVLNYGVLKPVNCEQIKPSESCIFNSGNGYTLPQEANKNEVLLIVKGIQRAKYVCDQIEMEPSRSTCALLWKK